MLSQPAVANSCQLATVLQGAEVVNRRNMLTFYDFALDQPACAAAGCANLFPVALLELGVQLTC
jgi:hypothetical protein